MDTNTNFYVCEVEWYDGEERKSYCLCNAKSYQECVGEIFYQYGKDHVISMKLTALEEGPLEVSKEILDDILNFTY